MKHLSRTRLFLLEMLVNLLVFCVGAAICLMTLSRAYSLSAGSRVNAQVQQVVQNVAMAFRAANGDPQDLPGMLSGRIEDGDFIAWYNQDWRPVAQADGIYALRLSVSPLENHVVEAEITVAPVSGGAAVAELSVRQYTGSAAGEGP